MWTVSILGKYTSSSQNRYRSCPEPESPPKGSAQRHMGPTTHEVLSGARLLMNHNRAIYLCNDFSVWKIPTAISTSVKNEARRAEVTRPRNTSINQEVRTRHVWCMKRAQSGEADRNETDAQRKQRVEPYVYLSIYRSI